MSSSLVVLLCQFYEDFLVHALPADKWRICFQHDASLLAPLHNIRAWEPRVQFDLV